MLRVLSWMSFAAVFLIISPKLRDVAMDGIAFGVDHIVKYSPWSYIGFAVIVLLCAMRAADRSSQLREMTRRD